MSAEHVGEGLLAILRGEGTSTAGFVRDLERAAKVRVKEITVDHGGGRVRLELIAATATPLAKPDPSVTALPQAGSDLHVKQPSPEWDVPPDDPGRRSPQPRP